MVSGDCLEMGWWVMKSRFDVGVCAAMGWCAVMSRFGVGVCRGCADWAVFSRFGLLGCFSRIADFQRSCWEFVRWMAVSLQSPALDAGVYAGIGEISSSPGRITSARLCAGLLSMPMAPARPDSLTEPASTCHMRRWRRWVARAMSRRRPRIRTTFYK